jgi:hypothetical protein
VETAFSVSGQEIVAEFREYYNGPSGFMKRWQTEQLAE